MQKRYRLASVISFLGLCYLPPNASAQDHSAGQDEMKGARQVFSASFAAMGGERALEAIRSIKALADCAGPKGPYTTEIHSARGDRLKFRQASPDGSSFLGLVNGRHAWTIEAQSGDVTPLGKSVAAMLRGHEFQMIAIVPQERFQRLRVEGYEDFAGSRAIKLSATDELSAPASLFFHADSNLLSGMVIVDPRSDGNETVRIVYREWRQIGRVKLPSKITATDRSGEFALSFHRITLNDVSERLFEVPPPIASVAELLRLHERQREAHLKKDAEMLVAMFADDFVSISAGKIERPSKAEGRRRFQAYFDRSTFLAWDDISPPTIRVSRDDRMAYVIVHKRVRLKANDEKAGSQEETTIFAWLETYEKQHARWALKSLASTKQQPVR